MFQELDVDSIRAFYDRWSITIFRLCELLVGARDRAEKVTEVAFLTYFRAGPVLDSPAVPAGLLRHALEAARSAVAEQKGPVQDLRSAIRCLPFEERAVFILRSVLEFDFGWIAEVTGSKGEHVRRTWIQSLMLLRQFLPREFFNGQSRSSISGAPKGQSGDCREA